MPEPFGHARGQWEDRLEIENQEKRDDQQKRYETLQQVSGIIASQADLNGVLKNLA